MERYLTREIAVPLSLCDRSGRLSVQGVFSLFMDMATVHAGLIGVGLEDMTARGLFWLTVRTRARLFRRPALGERVTLATWPEKAGGMRCHRDYTLRAGEELLAAGKTEWAVMDTAALRLRPVKDVYPPELEALLTDETVWDESFARLREPGEGGRTLGTYTVASTDIDVGGHMNNAAYVRMLMGAFSSRELEAMDIRDVELCYRAPCFEGETLTILAAPGEEGTDVAVLRPDGKSALLGRIR
jgi:acyl-ACP thioesterase